METKKGWESGSYLLLPLLVDQDPWIGNTEKNIGTKKASEKFYTAKEGKMKLTKVRENRKEDGVNKGEGKQRVVELGYASKEQNLSEPK